MGLLLEHQDLGLMSPLVGVMEPLSPLYSQDVTGRDRWQCLQAVVGTSGSSTRGLSYRQLQAACAALNSLLTRLKGYCYAAQMFSLILVNLTVDA